MFHSTMEDRTGFRLKLWHLILIVIACLWVGIFLGIHFGTSDPIATSSEPLVVPTQTIAVPGPTVTVTVTKAAMPESCAVMIEDMVLVQPHMDTLINASGRQITIIQNARTAIIAGDAQKLNEAGADQRELLKSNTTAERNYLDATTRFNKHLVQCKTDLGR